MSLPRHTVHSISTIVHAFSQSSTLSHLNPGYLLPHLPWLPPPANHCITLHPTYHTQCSHPKVALLTQ